MPGRIAPLTMGWMRRMGGIAGPLSASGEASNDEPVQIELYINGEWVDITSYVMVRDNSGNISINRGRRDEGSTTEQSSCQITLNNRDGRWSPRNPTGAYYGHIGRNQPVRISVPNGLGGKSYRFQGEISIWPQSWDPTGTDVWTEVHGSGILRRLSQGPAPAYSVIRDAISRISLDTLKAYWPCEDPEGSTEIASALTNGSPMQFAGTPELASFSGFGASDPLPVLTTASLTGGVALYSMTGVTEYQFRYLMAIPKGGISNVDVVSRLKFSDADTMVYLDVHFNDPPGGTGSYGNPGTLTIIARDGDEAEIGSSPSITMDVRGRLLLVSVECSNSGSDQNITLRVLDVINNIEDSATQTLTSTNVSRVLQISVAPETLAASEGAADTAFGHITLETDITSITSLGRALQPSGEAAGRRVERMCSEEGIAFESLGSLDDTVALGGQSRVKPLELMQEAESADGGMLYESMPMLGLGYRTRTALCNQDAQLTLNYAGFNLSEVPTPVEDDRYIQNQVTVTVNGVSQTYSRTDGALSTAQPPAGVGIYGTDVSLNLHDSDEALSQAAWHVHLGTVDEPRYPQISVNLAHSSFTATPALKQAVLGLKQGDRIVVQNLPSWLPPGDIDQIILGFDETITHFEHRITFVCAPFSPYRVGVFDDVLAVIDTDGSELLSAVDDNDTSLTVVPSSGQTGLWTTDSSNFPVDVRVGGEVMRVTNITNWLTDTFTRTESSSWGTPDVGSAWSTSGGAASDYSVNGSAGVVVLSTVDASRRTSITAVSPDFDLYCDITTSALATGDSLYGAVTARMQDSSNMYMARVAFTTSNTIVVNLQRMVANTQTTLATYTLPDTHVAGQYTRLRFQGFGSAFKIKAWMATDAVEPSVWNITANDSSLSSAYSIGTRSIRVTGNTNAASVEVRYENFRVVNPQIFTVTRSVNGVVKSQSAGEDLRLAYPTIISL